MTVEWVSALATVVSALAALCTVAVALYAIVVAKEQLIEIRNTLRNDVLMTVLSIESELAARKAKCDETSIELERLLAQTNLNQAEVKFLSKSMELAVENWLNALERLCFCINKSYVSGKSWRAEYQKYIEEAVENNQHLFGAATRYKNIKDLYERWVRNY